MGEVSLVPKHLKSHESASVLKHPTHHCSPNVLSSGSILENISIHPSVPVNTVDFYLRLPAISPPSPTVPHTQNSAWRIGFCWDGWLGRTLAAACRLGSCNPASTEQPESQDRLNVAPFKPAALHQAQRWHPCLPGLQNLNSPPPTPLSTHCCI